MRKLRAHQIIFTAIAVAVALGFAGQARAGTLWVWVCGTWTRGPGVMHEVRGTGYQIASSGCPRGGLYVASNGTARDGGAAGWRATAPAGTAIVGAWVPPF